MDKLQVYIADTPDKREYGLMNRKTLDINSGMLFKFPFAHRLSFWMKKTYIPLDIAFINEAGKITQIEKMYPLSTKSISSYDKCKYALEVNSGWFDKNSVKVGASIKGPAIEKSNIKCAQVVKKKPQKEDKPEKKEDLVAVPDLPDEEVIDENTPPEIDVEGEYPQSVYTVPYEEGEKPEIDYIRDLRGKIRFANDNNLEMEILYWTKKGYMLPPRRVKPLDKEGYVIKNGKTGELLVAFDISATIQGAGWSIKGGQPKSFLLDNIVQLQIFDSQGNQLNDEQVSNMKNQQKQPQQPIQENEQKEKRNFWERLRNIF